jgi:hypothetical protein
MDVHPPHEPIHSWRDFLLHLTIVTIGLFIALMLEAAVEWQHHRYLVHEARTNLRQEIEENRKNLRDDLTQIKDAQSRARSNLETLRTLQATHRIAVNSLNYQIAWSTLSQSAWLTARDTGALSFMNYAEVQRYADLYTEQEIADSMALRLLTGELHAVAPVFSGVAPEKLAPAEIQSMIDRTQDLYSELFGVGQVAQELSDTYTKALSGR